MARFQPLLPLIGGGPSKRMSGRIRTWQLLGAIVLVFLAFTFIAVRYLPTVVIDPVTVFKNQDFKNIFVPPIPKPPIHWPIENELHRHNHSLHLMADHQILKQKIDKNKLQNIDAPNGFSPKSDIDSLLLLDPRTFNNTQDFVSSSPIPAENLTELFKAIPIDQLQHIKSPRVRREKVREMLYHSYSKYAEHAWGANEYRPISKTSHSANVFGTHTLGITIIDSLDTLYLADLKHFYHKSREWIDTKFDPNVNSEVSVFEINIRLVGGFLSIYALTNDKMYLDKAQLIADRLLPAFNTPTGVPYALITLATGASKNWNWAAGGCSILSEVGTMHLEFQYLSELTGKTIYLEKAEKIRATLKQANENDMYYNYIHPSSGKWCQKHASLGGLGDSFYEYLLKSWILSGKKDEEARSMYEKAMKAAEESMLRKTGTSNMMYFGEQRSGRLDPQMGHLTCFVGGLYSLSASTSAFSSNSSFKHQMDIAQGIGKTCRESYIRAATGLGPEGFHFERTDNEGKALRDNEKYYILRPEAIETWFYLWRSTHDQMYRDWAWDALVSLEKYCRVDGGYSGIRDVYTVPVSHDDVQQSFFIAETLKYLLLIFSDDSVVPLETHVFNTEAHPFRIRTS